MCIRDSGTTEDLDTSKQYDSILYIDVIEHIEDDRGELARAASLIRQGGHLIVLVPAHQFLWTPFDEAIGHFRRYNRSGLEALAPPGCDLSRNIYLDAAGITLSLGNRLMLRQSDPTPGQIRFWDRVVVPISRVLDVLTLRRLGKSCLAVWRKVGDN